MGKDTTNILIPAIGDIVCHHIYSKKEWMAIIIKTGDLQHEYKKSKSLVRMLPGVEKEDYFFNKSKSSTKTGWVYTKWLWVLSRR